MLKISDIASHVGVSATTVSYVLNDGPSAERISEKTRQKVLQAAEDLGYRSNSLARAMRTGDTKMLGILGGKTTTESVGRMLEGALSTADLHGNTLKLLRLHAIGNSPQQAIRRSSEWRLTGLLALHLPEQILEDLYLEAQKYGTPLVLMDTYCQNPSIPQVVSDDEQGFALGVEHLVKLGHTNIAFIASELLNSLLPDTASAPATDFVKRVHIIDVINRLMLRGSYFLFPPKIDQQPSFVPTISWRWRPLKSPER
jgi:LacI family transcriptional regulator